PRAPRSGRSARRGRWPARIRDHCRSDRGCAPLRHRHDPGESDDPDRQCGADAMSVWSHARQVTRDASGDNLLAVIFHPRTLRQQQMRLGYALVLPSLVVLIFTVFYPIAQTVVYSLHTNRLNMPYLGTPFVGLTNYVPLLLQPAFWKAVAHTVEYTLITVAGELILGLLVALTINQ